MFQTLHQPLGLHNSSNVLRGICFQDQRFLTVSRVLE